MARTQIEAEVAGQLVRFDVDEVAGVGPERISRRGSTTIARLDESLDEALARARPAAEAVINAFRGLAPGEVSVEFGLKVEAEGGVVFARAGVGVHFTVGLKWTPADAPTVAAAPTGGRTPDSPS